MAQTLTTWINNSIPEDCIGFLYTVKNLVSNKTYVGSKFTVNSRTKKYDKSWLTYKTSSKYVKQDIKLLGEDKFEFKILQWYNSYLELRSAEVNLIKETIALGNCYNKNIGGRIIMDDEVANKIQETFKLRGYPMKGKSHPNKGKHINSGHKLNIGKKYYNNGTINKIDFTDNVDLTIWKEGMIRYQSKNPNTIKKELIYKDMPNKCYICNTNLEYKKRNNKVCSKICASKYIKTHHINKINITGHAFVFSGKVYITPLGEFKNAKVAAKYNNISVPTIYNRCINNDIVIKYNSRIPKEWNGLTWKELGWGVKYEE